MIAVTTVNAQINISIPKIPKVKKGNPSNDGSQGNTSADRAANGQSWSAAIGQFNVGYDPELAVAEPRAKYIVHYLGCYAKKHNVPLSKIDDAGLISRFYTGFTYKDKDILKNELPKLAELERLFKQAFPNRPDTGKGYSENPAIWDDILTNREEYYQCILAEMPDPNDCSKLTDTEKVRLQAGYKDDMDKVLDQVKTFTRDRGWYTNEYNENYVLIALSPRNRNKFAEKMGNLYQCLSGELDQIQAEAKKTLPNYTLSAYNTKIPADERVMRSAINDLDKATIYKIGLEGPNWIIEKNEYGLPIHRYKHGAMWVKYSTMDTGFCQILWINVIQDYAGGGTWGQSYGNFVRNEPAGCPVGK